MKKMKLILASIFAMSLLVSCSDGDDDGPHSEPAQIIAMDMNLNVDGIEVTKATVATGYNVTFTYDSTNSALAPADGDPFKLIYPELTFTNGSEGVTCVMGKDAVAITAENSGFVPVDGKANTYMIEIPLGVEFAVTFKKEGSLDTVITIKMVDTSSSSNMEDAFVNFDPDSPVTAWSVYTVADLVKLAEVVNEGNDLADYTITQKANIVFNEDLLGDGYTAPEEADVGEPNADFVVFEGIGAGTKDAATPFSGIYDGQGRIISGAYVYGAHLGLGFFGYTADATIKNVVLVDSCVVNACTESDQVKEFGGLVGVAEGETEIINCVYVGAVGSDVAKARGGWIDNVGGIVGKAAKGSAVTIENTFAHVNIVAGGFGGLVGDGTATITDSYAVMGSVCYIAAGSSAVAFDADVKDSAVAVMDAEFGPAGADLATLFQATYVPGKIKFTGVDVAPENAVNAEIEKTAIGDYTAAVTFDASKGTPAISLDIGFAYPGDITVAENDGTPAPVDTVFVNGSYAITLNAGDDITKVFTFAQDEHTATVITLTIKDQPEEVMPADSISTYADENETRTSFSVYNYKDLKKLAELVTGGNGLEGVTITQKADIAINDSVLNGGWAAPEESSAGQPNADLTVFDGIGKKDTFFMGTYDGQGYTISGLYIYTHHSHTGFFAGTLNATLKNIIITDACVVADGTSGDSDDRIGGLVGTARGTEVSNCVYYGIVGSQAACDGAGNYEYVGGLFGQCEKGVCSAANCVVVAQIFAESNSGEFKPVCGKYSKGKSTEYLTFDDTVKGYEPAAYEAAKDTVDAEIAAVVEAAQAARQ